MKRITVVLGIAALAALLPLTPALAETTLYKIDPNHSVVGFSIRHLFSKVPGRFNDFEGTIQFDDKNMAASSVETTIKTASIFTNQEKRDTHLRSADFFAADSFPTITFKSTKVTPGENNKFQIEGDLTIQAGPSESCSMPSSWVSGRPRWERARASRRAPPSTGRTSECCGTRRSIREAPCSATTW